MKPEIYVAGILLMAFLASIVLYGYLPQSMASHWNINGEADGFMPTFWGAFLLPATMVGLAVLFKFIPRLDPLKKNISSFRNYYSGFVIVFLSFMLALHVQMLLWNIGYRINPNVFMPIALAVLFFYVGVLCEKSKRNWFIGIRTPWTLSSDRVWNKTNKLAGKLFKVAALVALIGVFIPKYSFYVIIIPILLVVVISLVYSYIEYRQ